VGLVDLGGCIRPLVLTVAKNVKCPFSRLRSDRSIAANAFQSIGVHVREWRGKGVDSGVDANSVGPEKCTRQFAVTVAKRVRYHSSLLRGDQSIVGNVGKSIGLPDDTEWVLPPPKSCASTPNIMVHLWFIMECRWKIVPKDSNAFESKIIDTEEKGER